VTLQIDTSTWRLPGFVEQAFHRDELARSGGVPLLDDQPPARGQHVAVQVNMFDGFAELDWGIIKGTIDDVFADGRISLHATLTSEGPAALDASWQLVLRYYPEQAADEPWFVESMQSEAVVAVPRMWPRLLVDRLRESGSVRCADDRVSDLLGALRSSALEHATTPDPYVCANLTSRALINVLKKHPAVERCVIAREQLTDVLERVWELAPR
jgi:hypothetical protein